MKLDSEEAAASVVGPDPVGAPLTVLQQKHKRE